MCRGSIQNLKALHKFIKSVPLNLSRIAIIIFTVRKGFFRHLLQFFYLYPTSAYSRDPAQPVLLSMSGHGRVEGMARYGREGQGRPEQGRTGQGTGGRSRTGFFLGFRLLFATELCTISQ